AQATAEFDAAGMWELDAEVSMTAWLRERGGMTNRSAARIVATGRRLADLPATAAAWRDGRLSSGQIEAVTAHLNPSTAPRFAELEADLVPLMEGLSARETATLMRAWKARLETVDPDQIEPVEATRAVHLSCTLGEQWRLDGDLDPESGQLMATAIRLAESADVEGEPARSAATRRADALVDVCRFFLDHQTSRTGGRHRPHLNVLVDIGDLAARRGGSFVDGGGVLDGPSVSALLCDSALHRVVTEGRSAVLDYGTSTRTIPAPLWSALVVRDRCCRFPGCERPSWWCDGHHVKHVEHGGPTSLSNLVLGCRRHHRILHRAGWQAKLLPDATFEVTDPAGLTRTSRPPGTLC
ncbi:MAG: hypothetical protein QOG64_1117, partial [Acidimicrobiaceae bacterium]|nr:hypothetical protein [Acidimicrobiaceae bacterium]